MARGSHAMAYAQSYLQPLDSITHLYQKLYAESVEKATLRPSFVT